MNGQFNALVLLYSGTSVGLLQEIFTVHCSRRARKGRNLLFKAEVIRVFGGFVLKGMLAYGSSGT